MSKVLRIVFLCFLNSTLLAQYVPNSNQAFHFAPALNPAFTGIEGYRDLKLSYRYQWSGFGSNAPKFVNLAYNFRVKEPLDLTLHAVRTNSSTTRRKKDEIPTLKKVIHGLGANVFNERVGPITRIGGGINYAFHYPITNVTRLSAGVSAVLDNTKLDLDKLTFDVNPDPFYDRLKANGANHTELNIRAGLLVYSPRFYAGFSYYPVLYKSIKTSEITVDEPFYKGTFQAGAAFPLTSNIDIKPSILALWQMDNKFAVDYNVKMYVDQRLWFGASYRDIQSIVGIIGFNLNELLGASYSYEISTSGMQQFSDGSHELVLSLRMNNFKRLSQQTW